MIDDLGDRDLTCDLLLNQNLGANTKKYDGKVPRNCKFLLGPSFALLRNEFREWRERSLKGRLERHIENILITMGGVDAENYTLRVLKELTKSKYAKNCAFTVVIGGSYPHKNNLNEFVRSSALKVSVLSNVMNMAEIMSKSDLCIGAAGSSSWERCCLGLPTISLAIADNQISILDELEKNACTVASIVDRIFVDFDNLLSKGQEQKLRRLSLNSAKLSDGDGVRRVLSQLGQFCD